MMLLQTLLLGAFALVATALPSPIPTYRKAVCIAAYNITDFAAAAVVLSHRVYYRFNVTFDPNLPKIECDAYGTTLDEDLSSIPETLCGPVNTTTVSFKWTRKRDGGADMLVKRVVDSDGDGDNVTEEAIHVVPKSQIGKIGEGKFARAMYEGPENFSIPAFRFKNS